jgi:DnaB helicase-like protein
MSGPRLSAPIHILKRRARLLSRTQSIPLHAALDRIAAGEGYPAWSLLAARAGASPILDPGPVTPAGLHARLRPGDLLLIGARPLQGKTAFGFRLAIEVMNRGGNAFLFSLDYPDRDIDGAFRRLGADPVPFGDRLRVDCSDDISAAHIIGRLDAARERDLVVIDYLQLLDQKRANPPLDEQVRSLRQFARGRGLSIAFLCQIDRSYDPALKPMPGPADIRLPNPLDLSLFDRMVFLQGGKIAFTAN